MTSKEECLLFAFILKSVQSDLVTCKEGQDVVLLLLSVFNNQKEVEMVFNFS